jgi:hypothetical protein
MNTKAFNCLPHDILIYKLSTYGLSDYATKLLLSYLSNRKQQIKMGNIVSTWANIQKDVPQGSRVAWQPCPFLNAHKKWSKILSKNLTIEQIELFQTFGRYR